MTCSGMSRVRNRPYTGTRSATQRSEQGFNKVALAQRHLYNVIQYARPDIGSVFVGVTYRNRLPESKATCQRIED